VPTAGGPGLPADGSGLLSEQGAGAALRAFGRGPGAIVRRSVERGHQLRIRGPSPGSRSLMGAGGAARISLEPLDADGLAAVVPLLDPAGAEVVLLPTEVAHLSVARMPVALRSRVGDPRLTELTGGFDLGKGCAGVCVVDSRNRVPAWAVESVARRYRTPDTLLALLDHLRRQPQPLSYAGCPTAASTPLTSTSTTTVGITHCSA
jgi:hypothetical protein